MATLKFHENQVLRSYCIESANGYNFFISEGMNFNITNNQVSYLNGTFDYNKLTTVEKSGAERILSYLRGEIWFKVINQLKPKNMNKLSYKIIKEYKGLQLVKTDKPYNGDFYGVRYKVERKAKMGLTFEEAVNVFYNCIK